MIDSTDLLLSFMSLTTDALDSNCAIALHELLLVSLDFSKITLTSRSSAFHLLLDDLLNTSRSLDLDGLDLGFAFGFESNFCYHVVATPNCRYMGEAPFHTRIGLYRYTTIGTTIVRIYYRYLTEQNDSSTQRYRIFSSLALVSSDGNRSI